MLHIRVLLAHAYHDTLMLEVMNSRAEHGPGTLSPENSALYMTESLPMISSAFPLPFQSVEHRAAEQEIDVMCRLALERLYQSFIPVLEN